MFPSTVRHHFSADRYMTKLTSSIPIGSLIFLTSVVVPGSAFSECLEYKIIEHEDSVEAVCVGPPLTEAELKAKKADEAKERQQAEKERAAAMREAARVTEQMKSKDAPRSAERDKSQSEARKEKKKRRLINTGEELE